MTRLRNVLAILVGVVIGQASACACLGEPKSPTPLIDKCVAEVRAEHYLNHISPQEAALLYDTCIAAGLPDAGEP